MARAKLNTDGQTQSVSIRLSHQENDILNRYAAEHGIGRSAAASQLIRTGPFGDAAGDPSCGTAHGGVIPGFAAILVVVFIRTDHDHWKKLFFHLP